MDYKVRKEVLVLKPYVAGKPISELKRELGIEEFIKLAANENPLGCSLMAKKALETAIFQTQFYPEPFSYELRKELAKKLNVELDMVFCSNGSDSLIKVITNAFLNPEDEIIMGEVSFSRYEDTAQLMGSKVVTVPMNKGSLDIEKMVAAINTNTKIIWFCNPNNPTGTIFTHEEFEKVMGKIPQQVIVVMDEAYVEYVQDKDFPDSLSLLEKYENIIVLRTFSKAYGLAGLRVGYGVANKEVVKYFNSIIGPFDVNYFAQKAAVAALKDEKFLEQVIHINNKGKEYLCLEFEKMGFTYLSSNANFIAVNINRDDKPVFNALMEKGILIRPGFLFQMPGWLRITIGNMEQNEKFILALKQCL